MQTLLRVAAIGLAALILVLSLLPISGQASVPHADKVQHFVAYGALAGLAGLGWPRAGLWVVAGGAALFGVGVEIAQAITPTGRSFSGLDMLANAGGAGLAALALRVWRSR